MHLLPPGPAQMPRAKYSRLALHADAKGCVTPPDEREPELLADRGSAQAFQYVRNAALPIPGILQK